MVRYGKKASSKVRKAMHERKRGTSIAIGLSQARRAGGKVPPRKSSRSRRGRRKSR